MAPGHGGGRPRKVIVTRAREQIEPLARRVEELGYEVVRCPLIELQPTGPDEIDVDGYDWAVVTSALGARELLRRARGRLPPVAAIGPGTAAALRDGGVEPAFVPRVSTQEGLVAELPGPVGRVLFAGAERARRHLVDALDADFVGLYRTTSLRPEVPPSGDLVVLASASAAEAFGALGLDVPVVSIGPETSRAARAAGLRVVEEAETHDLDGLVTAVARAAV
ncbi:MAG TPA: uroporphyrinogen-III synthase [Gaiellaceae bacterium]|nr:uroporphyrinogen-III synthase [Gaiellaceae bacterium]